MKKILLVDDDEDLLLILVHALRANGYSVISLANPALLVETIALFKPAIIILDISMGQWDGRTICAEIKGIAEYRDIQVVLYSALPEHKDTLQRSKANLFLHKPLSTSHFLKKLSELSHVL